MSDAQEKVYHAEAVRYVEESGIRTHAIWRDLTRAKLEFVREGKVNWTTYETLDTFIEIYEANIDPNKGKKLKEFAPNVSERWIELCDHADRKLKLREQIRLLKGR